ncbi:hypothetical protein [Sedimenticola thiotaurini]|uniref:hypothetical protein n=1 Tax=Sedimenticola thiotaurini TaxID=1543721 RepID=UPI001900839B|nr:hypothetical protein [Sedimenticola thiotaurini]
MSRRSERDDYDDDLDQWSNVVHHRNRRQGEAGKARRSTTRDREDGPRKRNSSRRNSNRYPDSF